MGKQMTVRSVRHSSNSSHWNPAADALWRNRVESIDDTHPTSIVLRHPGTPYAEVIPDTTEAVLFEVGRRYVERANERAQLGIPPAWIAALRDPENPDSTFGWSRVWARDDTGEAGRGASFWMERGGRAKIDCTLVLVAGVVMLTGIGHPVNELTSPLQGADAYIDKPFEFPELDAKIKQALALRKKQRDAVPRPDSSPDVNGVIGLAKAVPRNKKKLAKKAAPKKKARAASRKKARAPKKAAKAAPKKKARTPKRKTRAKKKAAPKKKR